MLWRVRTSWGFVQKHSNCASGNRRRICSMIACSVHSLPRLPAPKFPYKPILAIFLDFLDGENILLIRHVCRQVGSNRLIPIPSRCAHKPPAQLDDWGNAIFTTRADVLHDLSHDSLVRGGHRGDWGATRASAYDEWKSSYALGRRRVHQRKCNRPQHRLVQGQYEVFGDQRQTRSCVQEMKAPSIL